MMRALRWSGSVVSLLLGTAALALSLWMGRAGDTWGAAAAAFAGAAWMVIGGMAWPTRTRLHVVSTALRIHTDEKVTRIEPLIRWGRR